MLTPFIFATITASILMNPPQLDPKLANIVEVEPGPSNDSTS